MVEKARFLSILENVLGRFPNTLDARLIEGFERVLVNAPKNFVPNRSSNHLLLVLITQFFLQNKIELAIEQKQYPFFVRLLRQKTCLCLMTIFPISDNEYIMGKGYLLRAIQRLIPSVQEVKESCFRWFHPKWPYICFYIEIQKMRGKELSSKEIRSTERLLEQQLAYFIPTYSPMLFCPFNEEEAYKQIQVLQKELQHSDDLPQVIICFREQSKFKLEFLVHLVRPQSDLSINQTAKILPSSISFFYHFFQKIGLLEAWCFSLVIPSLPFEENNAINLLCARRHITKYVEQLVGPFRDYNGGLLGKQQEKFEQLKIRLAETIPDFHLFAEKIFYNLQPIEARLTISFDEAERVFKAFSIAIRDEVPFKILRYSEDVLIVKTTNFSRLLPLINKVKEWETYSVYAQLSLSDFHYLCVAGKENSDLFQIEELLKQPLPQKQTLLRLIFQEGAPPSLNPHYAFGDIRCRTLSKLLFEGLTRMKGDGIPQLAAAQTMSCSQDGLAYTFKLRPYCWSNGEKVTACHFVNSWRTMLQDPTLVGYLEPLFVIKNAQKFAEKRCSFEQLGVYAHDTETLEVQLEWPDPIFLHKLAQPMFFPMIGNIQEPKLFNGPYLIQDQNFKRLVLECNPYYWDIAHIFFKQIQIDYLADIENSYFLFQEGKIDWIGDPFCALTSKMITSLQERQELQQQPTARTLWVYLNTQCAPLNSVKIRQALSLAIDRSSITEHIYPCNIPLYKPLSPSFSLCPSILSDNNPSQSQQLFEAGLKEINFSRKTFPLLTFGCPDIGGYKQIAKYLQKTWEKEFGVKVFIEIAEWNVFRSHLEKGKFQIGISGVAPLYLDPSSLLERFESTANLSQWKSPLYREKLGLAKKVPQKRALLLSEAEQLLLEEMPIIPICNFNALFAHYSKLKGYVLDHAGCVDFRWAYLEE